MVQEERLGVLGEEEDELEGEEELRRSGETIGSGMGRRVTGSRRTTSVANLGSTLGSRS